MRGLGDRPEAHRALRGRKQRGGHRHGEGRSRPFRRGSRRAVTGVAGPERDEDGNPVGLVYLACVRRGGDSVCVKQNFGDIGRSKIRYRAASEALTLLAEVASR